MGPSHTRDWTGVPCIAKQTQPLDHQGSPIIFYFVGVTLVYNVVCVVDVAIVQSLSCVRLFANPWTAAHQVPLSSISQSLLKFVSIELVMLSHHLILCRPLLLLFSVFPTIRVFSNESAFRIRWPKYWGFNFSISPSNEYSELISFRIDWFDFLAVKWTLKSLLQHHSSEALILWHSALTSIHDYWKNHSFDDMVSQCFHFPPFYLPEVLALDAKILVFWMLSFKPAFSLSSSTLKRLFSFSSLSVI